MPASKLIEVFWVQFIKLIFFNSWSVYAFWFKVVYFANAFNINQFLSVIIIVKSIFGKLNELRILIDYTFVS